MDNNKNFSSLNKMDFTNVKPKNGTSQLGDSNSTLKLESKDLEQLNEIVFNTDALQNIKTLIVTGTDLQHLPNGFTDNLGNLLHINLEENKLGHLPSNMKNLAKLQHLNISNNCLKVLTEEIGLLCELKVLRLENNNLIELPNTICDLNNLVHINIADNNLKVIPDNIGKLRNLEKLDVSGNMLENLPESVSELSNLCNFNVAFNKLSELPEGFTHLNKITVLNLSHNSFYDVPYCLFTGLPNLSTLDLSHNYINDFSEMPNCANKLRKLNLSHNSLFCMPKWIFRDTCKNLLEINFSYNKDMNGLGEDVYISPSNMKKLDLSDCNLSTISVCFLRGLHNLESLIMSNKSCTDSMLFNKSKPSGNVFWDLPINELKHACKLKELAISGVGLATLQDDIIQLSALQHLDLHSNDLNWLPDTFCDLVMLKTCNLSNNELALLPAQLGKLVMLTELNLDGNKLHLLPESLNKLENLEFLDLYDNIFEEVPHPFDEDIDKDNDEHFEDTTAEEENWDNVDEFNDNFDPTVLPPTPKHKPEHRRALLLLESLITPNNFCPADIHPTPIKSTVCKNQTTSTNQHLVEGQFDDSSS
ncbi:hypothetical protein C0J52_23415 [Blattella germanica]|nr:hypothetical protein C0J52_23415 [Blattella germanica]